MCGVHRFISLVTEACLTFYPFLSIVISLFLMLLVGSCCIVL